MLVHCHQPFRSTCSIIACLRMLVRWSQPFVFQRTEDNKHGVPWCWGHFRIFEPDWQCTWYKTAYIGCPQHDVPWCWGVLEFSSQINYAYVYNSKKGFLELTGIRNCNSITAYIACAQLELQRVSLSIGKPRKTIFESRDKKFHKSDVFHMKINVFLAEHRKTEKNFESSQG